MTICNALTFLERLKVDHMSEKDKLDIELFIKIGCSHMKKLEEEYNGFCIEEFQRRKSLNDPTTQEGDRKSWWSRRRNATR